MDYQRIYNQIIKNAKSENRIKGEGIYYEAHHIIPRCLGGEGSCKQINHPNIVLLTAREHFICHKLLVKMYPDELKLKWALYYMMRWKKYNLSSREYSKLKEENSKLRKQFRHTEETKEKISNILKGKKRTEEQKKKLRKPRSEEAKLNMRKPKSTTENMKGPKSDSHINNMKKPKPEYFGEIISNKLKNKPKPPRTKKHRKNLSTPILQFDLEGNFIQEFEGMKIAGKITGANPSTIGMVCRGKQKTAGGFIWKYKKESLL
jgi:hypothetical protein